MSSPLRWPLKPSLILGFLPVVACLVFFLVRIDPTTQTDLFAGETSDETIVQNTVERLGLIAFLLAVVASYGWIAPTFRERRVRLGRVSRWLWIPVTASFAICFVVFGIIAVDILDQTGGTVSVLLWFVALNLAIGVFEETLLRGVLVVGLRRRLTETRVLVVSSVTFGLLHLVNALGTQSFVDSLVQVAYATFIGAALYGLRRMGGGLLLPILLHAGIDLSGGGGGVALIPMAVLAIGAVFVAVREDRETRAGRRIDDSTAGAAVA